MTDATRREPFVLLVEDDDGIATPLAAALRTHGYGVERVATGRQALARAGRARTRSSWTSGCPTSTASRWPAASATSSQACRC